MIVFLFIIFNVESAINTIFIEIYIKQNQNAKLLRREYNYKKCKIETPPKLEEHTRTKQEHF